MAKGPSSRRMRTFGGVRMAARPASEHASAIHPKATHVDITVATMAVRATIKRTRMSQPDSRLPPVADPREQSS